MWDRKTLKSNAKGTLKRNYLPAVLAGLLLTFLTGGSAASRGQEAASHTDEVVGTVTEEQVFAALLAVGLVLIAVLVAVVLSYVLSVVLWYPLEVGCQRVFLECRDGKPSMGTLFYAFKNGFLNVGATMFLRSLFTVLWTLLLVVPGIVKAYEYRMIPFLLAENPQMKWKDAFAKSRQMMDGNKMNAFILDLSFIGWHLLSACTLGILGIFYVLPYSYLTDAELYRALKSERL